MEMEPANQKARQRSWRKQRRQLLQVQLAPGQLVIGEKSEERGLPGITPVLEVECVFTLSCDQVWLV
jgi:hypothetical protein